MLGFFTDDVTEGLQALRDKRPPLFPQPRSRTYKAACMPVKTHRTAVVAIPPPEVWEPIQAIRRQHDRNVHRWMPHITLLYPFMPREQFGEALPRLLEVSRQSAAFQVTLATFQAFTHAFGKATIWLTPEPRHAFVTCRESYKPSFLPMMSSRASPRDLLHISALARRRHHAAGSSSWRHSRPRGSPCSAHLRPSR